VTSACIKKTKCKFHMFVTTIFGGHSVFSPSKIFFLSNFLNFLASWVDYFLNYACMKIIQPLPKLVMYYSIRNFFVKNQCIHKIRLFYPWTIKAHINCFCLLNFTMKQTLTRVMLINSMWCCDHMCIMSPIKHVKLLIKAYALIKISTIMF